MINRKCYNLPISKNNSFQKKQIKQMGQSFYNKNFREQLNFCQKRSLKKAQNTINLKRNYNSQIYNQCEKKRSISNQNSFQIKNFFKISQQKDQKSLNNNNQVFNGIQGFRVKFFSKSSDKENNKIKKNSQKILINLKKNNTKIISNQKLKIKEFKQQKMKPKQRLKLSNIDQRNQKQKKILNVKDKKINKQTQLTKVQNPKKLGINVLNNNYLSYNSQLTKIYTPIQDRQKQESQYNFLKMILFQCKKLIDISSSKSLDSQQNHKKRKISLNNNYDLIQSIDQKSIFVCKADTLPFEQFNICLNEKWGKIGQCLSIYSINRYFFTKMVQYNELEQYEIGKMKNVMICYLIIKISQKLKINLQQTKYTFQNTCPRSQKDCDYDFLMGDSCSIYDLLHWLMFKSSTKVAKILKQWGGKVLLDYYQNLKINKQLNQYYGSQGQIQLFIQEMNRTAITLLLKNTKFSMKQISQNKVRTKCWSTTQDFNKLVFIAFRNLTFRKIAQQRQKSIQIQSYGSMKVRINKIINQSCCFQGPNSIWFTKSIIWGKKINFSLYFQTQKDCYLLITGFDCNQNLQILLSYVKTLLHSHVSKEIVNALFQLQIINRQKQSISFKQIQQ